MNNIQGTAQNQFPMEPAATFTKFIDGKPFTIRAFFSTTNVETMQQKIERLLHMEIIRAVKE